ncbi:MAG: helix-turn-helix domain-containing protein [Bacteroidales bacterium]|nr:helix-turn-helix domain-containing protein [Bacteroidales bacterium]
MNYLDVVLQTKSPKWDAEQYILFCVSGTVVCIVDGNKIEIKENMLFRKAKISSISVIEVSNDASFIQCVPRSGFSNYFQLVLPLIVEIRPYSTPVVTLSAEQSNNFIHQAYALQLLEKQIAAVPKPSIQERLLEVQHCCLCLFIALNSITPVVLENAASGVKTMLHPMFMEQLFLFCKEERNIKFYAEKMSLSTSYFSAKIKEETGKTPMYWINKITIDQLQKELAENRLTTKEICSKFHFSEVAALRMFFKKHTGYTINQYKEQRNRWQ